METLTQERLKQLLSYDPSTGIFTRNVRRRGPRSSVGAVAGCDNGQGYIRIYVDGNPYKAHRLAWLYMYGAFPLFEIDHINGRRSDNRLCNLRSVDRSQNNKNQPVYKSNASGLKGVSFNRRSRKWVAQIQCDGKKMGLGYFATAADAATAYAAAASNHFGEFARASGGANDGR